MQVAQAPEAEAARLAVHVQPRASRDEIVGWRDGALRVRVTAPPVEGEANRAVEALVARTLGVARSTVRVIRGGHGRDKLVSIDGLTGAELRSRLARMPPPR